jgi:inward rectifier potassium channel
MGLKEGKHNPTVSSADISRPRPFDDLYHLLLTASWLKLIAIVTVVFAFANLLFGLGYYFGGGIENARSGSFLDMFFFSVQTMATIGYGKMAPASLLANILASLEALFGLLAFAMMTGLVFAKFSLPSARVRFSRHALISNRDGVPSLMFRMANMRANRIVEAAVHVVFARQETTLEGDEVRRFYDLTLTRNRSALFALTWTAVHQIVEGSPLFGITREDFEAHSSEIVVSLTGLDETFSQTVHARHSYGFDDIAWGARFMDVIVVDATGRRDVDYSHFDDLHAGDVIAK